MSGSLVRLPAPDLPSGPRSALIVATTTYVDPSLRQLRAPAADATQFAEVMSDPDVGGFEVSSVIDRPAHEDPRRRIRVVALAIRPSRYRVGSITRSYAPVSSTHSAPNERLC